MIRFRLYSFGQTYCRSDAVFLTCYIWRNILLICPVLKFFFFLNIYLLLRDRETQSVIRGGAEREGDAESEAVSRLRAGSTEPDAGLEPRNQEIMT